MRRKIPNAKDLRIGLAISLAAATVACGSAEPVPEPSGSGAQTPPEATLEQAGVHAAEQRQVTFPVRLADGIVWTRTSVVTASGKLMDSFRDEQGRERTAAEYEAAAEVARAAEWKVRGAMSRQLYEQWRRMSGADRVHVHGFLRVLEPQAESREGREAPARIRSELRALHARFRQVASLDDRARITADESDPFVDAELSPRAVQAIAMSDSVLSVDLAATPELHGTEWRAAIEGDDAEAAGYTGTGVNVAVIEPCQPDAYTYLSGISGIFDPTDTDCATGSHATGVVGLVRSTLFPHGTGSGASIYIGNGDWEARWAITRVPNVINRSHSSSSPTDSPPTAFELLHDWRTLQYPYPLTVASAGNSSASFVSNKMYNGLIVTGTDQHATAARSDDTWAGHSYLNYTTPNGDREIPEVAAPSQFLTVAGRNGIIAQTSGAAPIVSGAVATLLSSNPSLENYPEGTKAIMMASADCMAGEPSFVLGNIRDDKVGVGEINAHHAIEIGRTRAQTGAWIYDRAHDYGIMSLSSSAWALSGGNYVWPKTFHVDSGPSGRISVVLTWDSTGTCTLSETSYSCSPAGPDANLDLFVFSPSGAVVAYSVSYDNTYEAIINRALVPNTTYTIRIVRRTPLTARQPHTYFGIAFTGNLQTGCPDFAP